MFEISETWLIDLSFLECDKSLFGRKVELFKYTVHNEALFFVLLFDNLMKTRVNIKKVKFSASLSQ